MYFFIFVSILWLMKAKYPSLALQQKRHVAGVSAVNGFTKYYRAMQGKALECIFGVVAIGYVF
jgi:hypothetical protein